jgi:Trk K+ transport system NAD-binding subunit
MTDLSQTMNESEPTAGNAVLVCGMGRLGQHCAAVLKELGIPVFGLDEKEPKSWEAADLSGRLDRFTVGDCGRHSSLESAGIELCQAALFTTDNERANISGALAARSLSPGIRVVIQSSQTNLNERLSQQLGNMMALDIGELPVTAFSLAALGSETVGLLSLKGRFLRVVE